LPETISAAALSSPTKKERVDSRVEFEAGMGVWNRASIIWPASFAVDVISTGSWFGGEESRLGDEKRRVVGSAGIEGTPNVGRIAVYQPGQIYRIEQSRLTFT
jgi:hypothetical protein